MYISYAQHLFSRGVHRPNAPCRRVDDALYATYPPQGPSDHRASARGQRMYKVLAAALVALLFFGARQRWQNHQDCSLLRLPLIVRSLVAETTSLSIYWNLDYSRPPDDRENIGVILFSVNSDYRPINGILMIYLCMRIVKSDRFGVGADAPPRDARFNCTYISSFDCIKRGGQKRVSVSPRIIPGISRR